MKEVVKWFNYAEFNPCTNHFDYKPYSAVRPMTKEEQMISFCFDLTLWIDAISIIATIIAALAIAAIMGESIGLLWILPTIAIGCTIFAISWNCGQKLEDKINHFTDWGFEIEELIYAQKQGEQDDIAKAWRAEHPLEEAIRKAQTTKNCTDIAELAREFAKVLK
jgi:hypothetical protein